MLSSAGCYWKAAKNWMRTVKLFQLKPSAARRELWRQLPWVYLILGKFEALSLTARRIFKILPIFTENCTTTPPPFQYKTERDGVVETRVEQKITIQSDGDPIDHDKALAEAIQVWHFSFFFTLLKNPIIGLVISDLIINDW